MEIGSNDANTIVIIKGYLGGKKNNTAFTTKKMIMPTIAEKIRGATMPYILWKFSETGLSPHL